MKKLLALLLALSLVFGCSGSLVFANTSQPSSWAVERVNRATLEELILPDVIADYQAPTTRGEFCRLVIRLLVKFYGKPINLILDDRLLTAQTFSDTDNYSIGAAAALGIVGGTGNGNFTPDRAISRQEAATMLRNTMKALWLPTDKTAVAWADQNEIATWALEATYAAYNASIMNGTSTTSTSFSPKTTYSHEMAIITMLNLYDYAKAQPPRREFDMNDPNVIKRPLYATARDPSELGLYGWRTAADIIADMQRDHPDYLLDGLTAYEKHFISKQAYVDDWVEREGLSYLGKSNREKMEEVIKPLISDTQQLEQFIGFIGNDPSFSFEGTELDCMFRSSAMEVLMLAMDFGFFNSGILCSASGVLHVTAAYWCDEVQAVMFVDPELGFGIWNSYIDEIDRQFILR